DGLSAAIPITSSNISVAQQDDGCRKCSTRPCTHKPTAKSASLRYRPPLRKRSKGRDGPEADSCIQKNDLFDHLVGADEERGRNFDTERFRGLEVEMGIT